MGWRGTAELGKGAASCTPPHSILPSSTQHQHCREQGCCGGMKGEAPSQGPASAFSSFRCPLVVFCTFQCVVVSHSPYQFWGLGPGSVQQAQCPGTMLESPGATSSDMVAGR